VRTFAAIALIVIVAGIAIGWLVSFRSERASVVIAAFNRILGHAAATFIVFAFSVKLAEHGGVALAFGIALGIFGLGMTALLGIRVAALWYVSTRGLPED
jgi:hypothetical protein